MADLIKVDTGRVKAAATNIAKYNNKIRDDFSSVQSVMTVLNGVWDGKAASAAVEKFHEIKNNYYETRYTVLNEYVTFLDQQVEDGYNQTEKVNTSLADLFK